MAIKSTAEHPSWIIELVRRVSKLITPLGVIGQLGFRYLPTDDSKNITGRWLIGIYLVPLELSGGRADGATTVAGFRLDALGLTRLLSDVSTLEWRVPRSYNNGLAGPELWLEGVYQETHAVQLHVYSEPPLDESPDLVLDVTTNTPRAK